ncbi:hypothetical protein [Fulvimarina sp. MAC8]|uniref:hypothetical protein n=1 Tax=Fulvimarina sp. MAC8 TaxID=3162874 RepID=UPI0032EF0A12
MPLERLNAISSVIGVLDHWNVTGKGAYLAAGEGSTPSTPISKSPKLMILPRPRPPECAKSKIISLASSNSPNSAPSSSPMH